MISLSAGKPSLIMYVSLKTQVMMVYPSGICPSCATTNSVAMCFVWMQIHEVLCRFKAEPTSLSPDQRQIQSDR